MRTPTRFAIPVVVLSLAALTACSSSDGTDSAATPSTTTTTTAANADADADADADYTPIPETPAADPASKDSLDFGTLADITTANGVVTLHVDRSTYYQGADAVANGAGESQDWIVKDTDGEGKELTFTLDPKASIQAEGPLSNDHEGNMERKTLTQKALLANFEYIARANKKNPDDATNVYVWLRHTDGADGPVTAIVDQFIP